MIRISVIIPVFEAEDWVEHAVRSAHSQPEVAEVILVEDGSSDNSLGICKQLERSLSNIVLVAHPDGRNHGPAATRNLGIGRARCDYIAFLDADDYYLEGRFSQARPILEGDPSVDGVYEATGTRFENPDARRHWACIPFLRGIEEKTTLVHGIEPRGLFEALLLGQKGHIHLDGLVVKRLLFERTGLFDESLMLHQDTAMIWKLSAIANLAAGSIDEPVAIRRIHGSNRILRWPEGPNPYLTMLHRIMLEWCSSVSLPHEMMETLRYRIWRDTLFNYSSYQEFVRISESDLSLGRDLRKLALLLKMFLRTPSKFASRFALRWAKESVWKRLT